METIHPVRDNYKFKETVHIPGARCLYLRFDPRCSSQYDYDKVAIPTSAMFYSSFKHSCYIILSFTVICQTALSICQLQAECMRFVVQNSNIFMFPQWSNVALFYVFSLLSTLVLTQIVAK